MKTYLPTDHIDSESSAITWGELLSLCRMWDNDRTLRHTGEYDEDGVPVLELPPAILPLYECGDGRVISESERGNPNATVWAYIQDDE